MEGEHGVFLPATNEAYEAWVRQHPQGYVVNASKSQTQELFWHRADCPHIGPAEGWRYVGDDLMKACALDPGELAAWVKQRPEGLRYCADCRSKWAKEHSVQA